MVEVHRRSVRFSRGPTRTELPGKAPMAIVHTPEVAGQRRVEPVSPPSLVAQDFVFGGANARLRGLARILDTSLRVHQGTIGESGLIPTNRLSPLHHYNCFDVIAFRPGKDVGRALLLAPIRTGASYFFSASRKDTILNSKRHFHRFRSDDAPFPRSRTTRYRPHSGHWTTRSN